MNYNSGDFIITTMSNNPAVIITRMDNTNGILISISEYNGDYTIIDDNNIIKKADLKSEEKLSIIANYDDWFYDEHKLLYQELIIENLGA